jgi:hypothetical protein
MKNARFSRRMYAICRDCAKHYAIQKILGITVEPLEHWFTRVWGLLPWLLA